MTSPSCAVKCNQIPPFSESQHLCYLWSGSTHSFSCLHFRLEAFLRVLVRYNHWVSWPANTTTPETSPSHHPRTESNCNPMRSNKNQQTLGRSDKVLKKARLGIRRIRNLEGFVQLCSCFVTAQPQWGPQLDCGKSVHNGSWCKSVCKSSLRNEGKKCVFHCLSMPSTWGYGPEWAWASPAPSTFHEAWPVRSSPGKISKLSGFFRCKWK